MNIKKLVFEHNTLNGFTFVLIEFMLVGTVCLALGILEVVHGKFLWAVFYLGVAFNSIAICITVLQQIKSGEKSQNIRKTYFKSSTTTLNEKHQNLGRHTLILTLFTLIPFLLSIILVYDEYINKGE